MAAEIYKPLLQTRNKFLGLGVDSIIGTGDKMTLLKYAKAQIPRDTIALTVLDLEAQILTRMYRWLQGLERRRSSTRMCVARIHNPIS